MLDSKFRERYFRTASFWIKVFLVEPALKLKRVKIIEVKTNEEKRMVYEFRYKIYNEYRYIEPKDFPNGELKDEYDEHSISFLALKNEKPIGTIRLILGNKKEDFPTFRMWNINFNKFSIPFSKTGELSKLCIINIKDIKDIKDIKYWIWLGMLKNAYRKSRELGHLCWVFNTRSRVLDFIKKKINPSIFLLPTLEDTSYNLKEREAIKGFLRYSEIFPYFFEFQSLSNL